MALVDVDSWLTEFESCDRLNHTLISHLNQRENKQHSSPEYYRITSAILVGLKQFDRELQQLKFKLNEASEARTITPEEVGRRQQLLDKLQSQRQQLQHKYTNSTRNDRAALLQTSSSSNWQSATKKPNVSEAENIDTAPIINTHDVQAFKQHQTDILEQQNSGLENLAQSISRQKEIATQFGQEVEDQNGILDNLINTIDRVETGVNHETRNIGLVNRTDSAWRYWLLIIILFIAIIIVALL